MLVFNLTDKTLVYRRRTLTPNGGSFNFLDLRVVPLRDQKLAQGKNAILAFGTLPPSWVLQQAQKKEAQQAAQKRAALKANSSQKKIDKAPIPEAQKDKK